MVTLVGVPSERTYGDLTIGPLDEGPLDLPKGRLK